MHLRGARSSRGNPDGDAAALDIGLAELLLCDWCDFSLIWLALFTSGAKGSGKGCW